MLKKTWWKEAVAYQIYPRSFMDSNDDGIGDLKGITQKLDYLKDLGIDVIWICPVFKSPNDDNGYDISDYQDIMSEFGSMEDFDILLEEVHKRGMKLILDLVINHSSDEHPWFIESRSSKDNPKRDWYIWRDGKEGQAPNNWESIFSGSAWQYDENTDQYYMHIFSTKQPDLNWENPEVRTALYDMVNWWLDKGIDGFRIDAISHIKKKDGLPDMPNPENKEVVSCFPFMCNVEGIDPFLSELRDETFNKYDIMTVGEANGVKVEEADKWVGEDNGYFDMIFQFEHLGLWNRGTENQVDVLKFKEVMKKWQTGLHNRGWNALFLENHDQPRSVSTWGNDDIYWSESAKMLAACYFLMQGTPFIYQGQELGMTNVQFSSIEDYNDVAAKNMYREMKRDGKSDEEIMNIIWRNGRDNSRTPMQWNAGKNAGFTNSDTPWLKVNPNYVSINVENQVNDEHSIYHFYRQLIETRKAHEVLIYGDFSLINEGDTNVFAYIRSYEDKKVLVVCNFTNQMTHFSFKNELDFHSNELLIHNYPVSEKLSQEITLNPYETRVYLLC